ncbi:MAG TPA: biliverdin-producing heme oxygenase [Devosia sp.]|nr:biliverdin-producing heme oxygenase [Devosia sp.]
MSRRFLLRQRTAAAHAAVDAAVGSFTDLGSYRAYLRALYAFRAPIEAQIGWAWPGSASGWIPSTICDFILEDMGELGMSQDVAGEASAPLEGDELLGALYVLEGSTLGARILLRRAEALGLSATYGARHLNHLAGNIDGWRGFLSLLEQAEPFDLERAVEASLAAFDAAQVAFQAR